MILVSRQLGYTYYQIENNYVNSVQLQLPTTLVEVLIGVQDFKIINVNSTDRQTRFVLTAEVDITTQLSKYLRLMMLRVYYLQSTHFNAID